MRMSSHYDVNILVLTDLHLGKTGINPHDVRDHLRECLYDRMADTDLLCIGGDFFDCLCNLNNDAGIVATMIVDDLLDLAIANNVYIRVVRGTFSHDRFQNRLFLSARRSNTRLHNKPLVRVIDNIELELFEDLKISVVYCPDDQPYTDITQTLLDLVQAHKLSKVDFIFSHGYYTHLLPTGLTKVPHNTLDYDRLEPILNGACCNGHVHIANVYKRVFNCGSFERMQHGDEGDKGYFSLHYNTKTHKLNYEFVVNKNTTPFITVDLNQVNNVEDALKLISNTLNHIRKQRNDDNLVIHLRLAGNSEFVAAYVRENFPNVILATKSTVTQDVSTEDLITIHEELPIITEDNLARMVYDNLTNSKTPLTLDEIESILDAKTTTN